MKDAMLQGDTGTGPVLRGRAWAVPAFLLAVALLSWVVFGYGYAQAIGQVAARGRADLALASDRLVTGLLRYRATAVLLSDHPALEALHAGGDVAQAERVLLNGADRTGAILAFYADVEGRVLASSEPQVPRSLTAQPWFARATRGALGASYGLDPQSGARIYSHAAPAFGPDGRVRGVLVMVVDLEGIEGAWRGSRPSVFFTTEAGRVIVTNRSEMMFWKLDGVKPVNGQGAPQGLEARMVAGYEIWHQSWSDYVPPRALHLTQNLPVIGMMGEALIDVRPARQIAALQAVVVAALCLGFGAVLWTLGARRRALALANTQLEGRVRARTRELEGVNAALRREVVEREDAEDALRRAQADLVQAGKLSALGQMSAGISHELNQPLMAIRQFAENGEAFLNRGKPERAGENLSRIADLAARAARIIKNLRAFAQGESEPMTRVDLLAVIGQAVDLTEARLVADGVTLDWQPPAEDIHVRAGEVRLGQVFVNLINNAADAMAGQPVKHLTLRVETGERLVVQVRDSGPGIADPEKVFEPFYSTKEVGDGMGLGLSISYGLVQSFGGKIRGANVEGGAEFAVELEPWTAGEAD